MVEAVWKRHTSLGQPLQGDTLAFVATWPACIYRQAAKRRSAARNVREGQQGHNRERTKIVLNVQHVNTRRQGQSTVQACVAVQIVPNRQAELLRKYGAAEIILEVETRAEGEPRMRHGT
jgi:hypothetical protein